jgi:hypothetical protein
MPVGLLPAPFASLPSRLSAAVGGMLRRLADVALARLIDPSS